MRFRRYTVELSASFTCWHLLMQLVTQRVSHRSDVAAMLTAYGHSPGDLDLLFFVLNQST